MCLAATVLAPVFAFLVVSKVRAGLQQLLSKKDTNGRTCMIRWTNTRPAQIDVSLHSGADGNKVKSRSSWRRNTSYTSPAQ